MRFAAWASMLVICGPSLAEAGSQPESDVVVMENNMIAAEVARSSGAITVIEKTTGTRWGGDPWDREVGELALQGGQQGGLVTCGLSRARDIVIEKLDDRSIRCVFRGLRGANGQESAESRVQTTLRIQEDPSEVIIQVDEVTPGPGWRFKTLHYPLRQFAAKTYQDEGYLVVPLGRDGYLIPSHHFPYPAPNFWIREDYSRQLALECTSLSMPWFGGRKGESAFIATLEHPADASLHVVANVNRWGQAYRAGREPSEPRILSGSVIWQASRGEFRYPRVLRYRFLPQGGYVEMAKVYREVARRQGEFVALKERVAQNPKVDRLIGAVLVGVYGGYPQHRHHPQMGFTYRDLQEMVRDMREDLAVPHAVINPWSIFGEQAPAFLPLNSRHGTLTELRSAVEYTRAAGYLFAPYTYYSAYHQESAAWNPRLEFRDGAALDSEVGKWSRACPSQFVGLAESYIPEMLRELPVDAVWVDIVTSGSVRECAHPDHPMSRQDDIAARRALYEYLRRQNLVIGSEGHKDWIFPLTDFAEGPGPRGAGIDGIGIRTPLLPLVYHDALVSYTFCGDSYNAQVLGGGDYNLKSLWDILCGNPPHWHFNVEDYDYWRPFIKQSADVVAAFAREIADQEMAVHEFLSADYQVHRTIYKPSGTTVQVNLSAREHRLSPCTVLKPYSFRIETPGREARQGQYSYELLPQATRQSRQP